MLSAAAAEGGVVGDDQVALGDAGIGQGKVGVDGDGAGAGQGGKGQRVDSKAAVEVERAVVGDGAKDGNASAGGEGSAGGDGKVACVKLLVLFKAAPAATLALLAERLLELERMPPRSLRVGMLIGVLRTRVPPEVPLVSEPVPENVPVRVTLLAALTSMVLAASPRKIGRAVLSDALYSNVPALMVTRLVPAPDSRR